MKIYGRARYWTFAEVRTHFVVSIMRLIIFKKKKKIKSLVRSITSILLVFDEGRDLLLRIVY